VRRYLGTTAADRTLCVLPLSHTYGLYQLLVSVRAGGSLQLRHGFALPGDLPAQLAASGTTVLPGVPSLWARLLAMPDFTEERLPTLAVLTNAGAALPVSCVQALRSRFPRARLFLMYGQTECGRALYLDPSLVDSHPAAAGGALPGTCTWLEQSDGSPVPLGSVGELFVSGPHLMSGYWEQPEQTSEKVVHRRGTRALRTGDLFTEDSDGLLHFVGRVDDVFEVGGERVAPLEVEHVLSAAPGVRDVAVLARPDGLTGRRVVAVVVPAQEDALDPVVLRRWCAERLAPAKVPREVLMTDALPRLPNGKLDRCSLLASLATPSVGAPPARPAEMHSEGR
jgi:acyl-CoA synthetase (AMP-forming)/AMP-acid ligase II